MSYSTGPCLCINGTQHLLALFLRISAAVPWRWDRCAMAPKSATEHTLRSILSHCNSCNILIFVNLTHRFTADWGYKLTRLNVSLIQAVNVGAGMADRADIQTEMDLL